MTGHKPKHRTPRPVQRGSANNIPVTDDADTDDTAKDGSMDAASPSSFTSHGHARVLSSTLPEVSFFLPLYTPVPIINTTGDNLNSRRKECVPWAS